MAAVPTGAATGSAARTPPLEPEAKPEVLPLEPTLVARIDLANQRMSVTIDGKTVHSWKISSGVTDYETPTGTFTPDWMAKMWYSRTYDGAPMPHAVFFKDGAAVHAAPSSRRLGRPASHGCVRLAPANARTFYNLVSSHGLKRTRIIVAGRAPAVRPPEMAARAPYDRYSRYGSRTYEYLPPAYSGAVWGYGEPRYYDERSRRRPVRLPYWSRY
ncbi:MAG: L,D-transpeptidase [Hyphomicrobiaceae bacterium]